MPNSKRVAPPADEAADKPAVAPVAGADPARAGGVLVAAPRESPAVETAATAGETAAPADPAKALVAEARKKLEAIDKLLGEAAK